MWKKFYFWGRSRAGRNDGELVILLAGIEILDQPPKYRDSGTTAAQILQHEGGAIPRAAAWRMVPYSGQQSEGWCHSRGTNRRSSAACNSLKRGGYIRLQPEVCIKLGVPCWLVQPPFRQCDLLTRTIQHCYDSTQKSLDFLTLQPQSGRTVRPPQNCAV